MLTAVVVYLLIMHALGFSISLFIPGDGSVGGNVTRALALMNMLAVVFVLVSI